MKLKSIFSTNTQKFVPIDLSLLLLRIFAGGFMLTHGFPKLMRILDGNFRFGDPIGLGPEVSLVLATFAEFFCSILLIVGLWTRAAAVPLIITMAVAAFIAHGDDPFSDKELPLLFMVNYLVLMFTGPGKYSIDQKLYAKS